MLRGSGFGGGRSALAAAVVILTLLAAPLPLHAQVPALDVPAAASDSKEPTPKPAGEGTEDNGTDSEEAAAPKPAPPPAPPVDDSLVVEAGSSTRGGLAQGARIVHVMNLDDNGKGSLRAALRKPCPCVIVFDVGGIIDLKEDLRISRPFTTIAGQTAPYPGILLRGHKLRIAESDVVVQHIAISPTTATLEVEPSIDAIGIAACHDCAPKLTNVRLENITGLWATDEVVGFWGDGISRVTVRNSLIAEALDRAGHPKETHSMGLLIGGRVEGVEVTGNLFASNKWRNPVVGAGASAYVANNYVYNPGQNAAHIYGDTSDRVTRATFIGNVVKRGPSSDVSMLAVDLPSEFDEPSKGARVFAQDNHCCSGEVGKPEEYSGSPSIVDKPPVIPHSWKPLQAEHVWAWVSRNAGSRPRERNAIDTRILEYTKAGGGKIIDNPKEVGGFPEIAPISVRAELPRGPFLPPSPKVLAETRLEAWLCLRHLEVGGPLTAECPDDEAKLVAALLESRPKK